MARFKKDAGSGAPPEINTGSMSDIIFMLLFFFMVITTMRESTLFVKINPPKASEVVKLEKKSLVSYIYIGEPVDVKRLGTTARVQLNDKFMENLSEIGEFIIQERSKRDEVDIPFMTVSLKVDKKVKMGIVNDVKQELRQAGAFKISYSTAKDVSKQNKL